MNDIYKQKVKKYKYKYLKLKKPSIGGGDEENEEKDITNINIKYNYDFEFIGQGGFGCIISPPLQFNNKIYIKNLINDEKLEEIFTSKDYVGKLLSCDKKIFIDEYEEFKKLDEIDKDANHRSKLIFAGYMRKHDIVTKLKELYDDKNVDEKTKEKIKQLYNCFIDPDKKIIYSSSSSENYGYIISTRVGKSFTKMLNSNNFNNGEIIKILENLKESVGDLIQKLYDDESIHGDIKFDNMTMTLNNKGYFDDNSKICFIDFGFKQKYNIFNTLITYNHQYPYILERFKMIINRYKEDYFFTKSELITELLNIENYRKRKNEKYDTPLIPHIMQRYFNNININYSFFFHSLEDNTKYKLKYFYTKCIKPIAKNIDIYALSLYIYILFNNIYSDIKTFYFNFNFNPNTLKILNELLINALYNNIDGPEELIIYIEEIINSIKNASYDIENRIKVRRRNIKEEEKKIPFYYYFFDKSMNIFLAK